MREPASPDGAEFPQSEASTDASAVSIPDRRRIDSDVRAFLREPSTPWIVFDQEGRPPSQLAVGELLPVAMSSIAAAHGFFPATAAIDAAAAHAKLVEPSSLAVASDLVDDEPKVAPELAAEVAPDSMAIPMRRVSGRAVGAIAATLGAVAVLAVGVFALRGASHPIAGSHSTNALSASRSFGAQSDPIDIPPPDFDVSAQAAKLTGTAVPAAPANAATRDDASAKVPVAAKKYGRLSVAGDARSQDVFFDGKRMLGRGARTFTVMCGKHTVAVGARTDAHEVEIPCTGTAELVIGK